MAEFRGMMIEAVAIVTIGGMEMPVMAMQLTTIVGNQQSKLDEVIKAILIETLEVVEVCCNLTAVCENDCNLPFVTYIWYKILQYSPTIMKMDENSRILTKSVTIPITVRMPELLMNGKHRLLGWGVDPYWVLIIITLVSVTMINSNTAIFKE